jgi:pimeloyl-ACP methyl ester carboxylesterase
MQRARFWIVVGILHTAGCTGGSSSEGDDVVGDDADASVTAPDAANPDPDPDATPQTFACAPTATAGHQTFDCPEGVTADVEISAACLDGGCGLIVDVHGYSMNADAQDEHTRMRELGPARGYVVIQPTAPGTVPSWGTGEHDDVVWELAEATIAVLDIDEDRVHFTGFSQGGMMSYRQLCAHADRLASIAPHAGGGCFAGQEPAVEVPILYVHGYRDTIVSWSGVAVPQRDAILATWDFGEPVTIDDGGAFLGRRWTTSSGTVFEMYEHDYSTGDFILAGHCLPGPNDQGLFRCDDAEFDSATLVLDFFDAHPRGEVD